MSTVAEIIAAVKNLNESEKGAFLDSLQEVQFDGAWDHQMRTDAAAGRLDTLLQQLDEEIATGKTRSVDEVCREL